MKFTSPLGGMVRQKHLQKTLIFVYTCG